MTGRCAALACAATVTLCLLPASATAAGGGVSVLSVNTRNFPQNVVIARASAPLVQPQVSLSENGTPISGVTIEGSALALVVDDSGAMSKEAMKSAIGGAQTFVGNLTGDTTFGVYGYTGRHAVTLLSFPSDAAATASALGVFMNGAAGSGQQIWQTMHLATGDLGRQAGRAGTLLLVTAHGPSGDPKKLHQAVAEARANDVRVDVIATQPVSADLRALTAATGGTIFAGRGDASFVPSFGAAANQINATVAFSYQSTAKPGQSTHLELSLNGSPLASSAFKAPGKYVPQSAGSTSSSGPGPTVWVVVGLAAGIVLIGLGSIIFTRIPRRRADW